MRVLVIGGGISSERDVSLRSARAIHDALMSGGIHETTVYDWNGSENWLNENLSNFDVVFPALHGAGGEDGQIQHILEKNNIAYVGTNSHSSKHCINKTKTKEILQKQKIRVPGGNLVNLQGYINHKLYNQPHVLKPVVGGSSIDTFIFPDVLARKDSEIERTFISHRSMLIEEYIKGTEITVPILGKCALPVIEIIPPQNATFDYENKYNGKTQELCPAVNITEIIQHEAQEIAINVHNIMDCRHLSRTDMIIQNNEIIVLEINTMPGFTAQSLFPKSANIAGIDMIELIDYIIKLAYEDK